MQRVSGAVCWRENKAQQPSHNTMTHTNKQVEVGVHERFLTVQSKENYACSKARICERRLLDDMDKPQLYDQPQAQAQAQVLIHGVGVC